MEFFVCAHCGNIIYFMKNSGAPVTCCGEKMSKLEPNTVDAATEKHIPVVVQDGNKVEVTVGAVIHPMTEEHHIEWIIVETDKGFQKVDLEHTGEPKAKFCLRDAELVAVYE